MRDETQEEQGVDGAAEGGGSLRGKARQPGESTSASDDLDAVRQQVQVTRRQRTSCR
jgi:hypothetical protein